MAGKIIGNTIFLVSLIVFMLTGLPLISQAEEATTGSQKEKPPVVEKKQAEKAPTEKDQTKKAELKVVSVSGDTANIELINTVPVRGAQFTVNGVKLTEVRTTSRTAGFFAKFSEENGIVIIASLDGDEIAPGKDPIAEIIYQKVPGVTPAISLSGVKKVGINREAL